MPGSCGASAPDSTYALTLTFPHTGSTDTIAFTAPSASGLNGFALGGVSVQVARPTVAIATADVEADAVNGDPGRFLVTRSAGNLANPLTVYFDTSGTESASQYTLSDAVTGQTLNGSVTIPAGSTGDLIQVTQTATATPDWTNTVITTLNAATHAVLSSATTATVDVVGAPPTISLGDGSGQIVLQGSADGTQNLVPLHLNYPAGAKTGATVTLSTTAPGEVDVWTTNTPTPGSTPFLGGSVSSVQLTVGQTPPSLFVGATHGSASVGDIVFAIADSDAGATPATTKSTTAQATTKPASAIALEITALSDPNSNTPASGVITNVSRNWLVGQAVDINAAIAGPVALVKSATYEWHIPGKVLRQYDPTVLPVVETLVLPSTRGVGSTRPEVRFFWFGIGAPAPGPDMDNVTVNVAGIGGKSYSVTTTFNVYSPITTIGNIDTGRAILGQVPGTGWAIQAAGGTQTGQGFGLPAQVTTPAGFAQGTWSFLQMVNSGDKISQNGTYYQWSKNGVWVLDYSFPLPASNILGPNGAAVPNAILPTGNVTDTFVDSPSQILSNPYPLLNGSTLNSIGSATRDDSYRTYILFKPAGAGSQWVALQMVAWHWGADVSKTPAPGGGVTWSLLKAADPTAQPAVAVDSPPWFLTDWASGAGYE